MIADTRHNAMLLQIYLLQKKIVFVELLITDKLIKQQKPNRIQLSPVPGDQLMLTFHREDDILHMFYLISLLQKTQLRK